MRLSGTHSMSIVSKSHTLYVYPTISLFLPGEYLRVQYHQMAVVWTVNARGVSHLNWDSDVFSALFADHPSP